ncbi:hypothetical protein WJX81_001664 [Elliptochloris bilobata]|uniref:rRNA adenine N(6)-methyltransferase n=1 Tax=Elliptochloris bilobata TaxID=381761 RepID=A0AAW1SHK2_9CHLO
MEIGPGTGNLTRHILRCEPKLLIAIEKDDKLAAELQRDFSQDARLRLVHADALEVDLVALTMLPGHVKVVANVPFNITTDLLRILLPLPNVASVHLMLQAEAAVRLTSTAAGDSAYRAISLFVAFYSVPAYCFMIDRRHFWPPPGVDAALAQGRA